MKNIFFFCFIPVLICFACSDDIPHQLNGMWQLRLIEDKEGETSRVDTVYYSFQRQRIFSFTVMENEKDSYVVYGYTDFPGERVLHVKMDTAKLKYTQDKFFRYSGWENTEETFHIKKVDNKNLIMISDTDEKIYSFIKF